MKKLLVVGLVGILGAGALGACGDDDDTTASTVGPVAQANAAFCQDLAAYGTALGSLIALDPATATKADYSAAVDDVTSAREEMVSAGKDLTEAEWTNLQTQVEDLTGTLKDAPDDVTVSSILVRRQRPGGHGSGERRQPEHGRLHGCEHDDHDDRLIRRFQTDRRAPAGPYGPVGALRLRAPRRAGSHAAGRRCAPRASPS